MILPLLVFPDETLMICIHTNSEFFYFVSLKKPLGATQIRCVENSLNCILPIIDIVRLKLKQVYELLYLTPTFSLCFSHCQTDAKLLLLCQVKTIR